MTNRILEMHNITKFFPGVKALDNVNFSVEAGEIHALVGENGAGKSTLMKILSGEYPHGSYSGAFFFNGKECKFRDINESVEEGIAIIHQEFALVPFLSIAENIFLGNERAMNGVINWTETNRKAKELLEMVGLHEAPTRLVANLGAGKQQLVEIAKALSKKVKLLILDEPTASLNETDSDALLELLLQIKGQGISSIFISHKLSDVSKIADSLTILRDGKTIETLDYKRDQVTEDRVIRGMVGRDLTHRFPPRASQIGKVIFEVKNWNVYDPYIDDRKMIKDVSLNVRQGEVLGIAGLMGSGRTELAMSIFGRAYGRNISGKAYKRGQEVDISTIEKAIKNGIVYVTEDRKNYGLILMQDIKKNITLTNLDAITEHGRVNESKEFVVANQFRDRFDIKCTSILQKTVNLSGGNQQKVMLSKWLFADPDILILDEPTRGIDVGAKYEIYTNINNLVAEGKAIILISSELPELLGICDRIYVMNEGSIVGEMPVSEASQEKIMKCIMVSQEVREQ